MKKKLFFVISACLLVLTGCGKIPKLQNGQEVVASIDGLDVTAENVYDELKEQYGIGIVIDKIDSAIADKSLTKEQIKDAEEYADNQISKIKAQYEMYNMSFEDALTQNGYDSESDLKKDIFESYKKQLVLLDFLQSELTEEEINEYYEKEIYGEMTVRHILITPEKTDDMTDDQVKEAEEKAKQKAEELIKKLNEGADFAELAKENSDDTGTASEGGLFANFTKKGVDESFFNASLELEKDKYTTSPVKSQFGYHIILKISQNEKPSLDKVIDDIKDTLVNNKLTEDQNLSITAWDRIRTKNNMKINDSALQKNYNKVMDLYKEK